MGDSKASMWLIRVHLAVGQKQFQIAGAEDNLHGKGYKTRLETWQVPQHSGLEPHQGVEYYSLESRGLLVSIERKLRDMHLGWMNCELC